MNNLIKQFSDFLRRSIPAMTIHEELPTATDIALEAQDVNIVDETYPLANTIAIEGIPTAAVSGPLLTIFGRMQKYCDQIIVEVFCSSDKYTQREAVKNTARKYRNMNAMEQLQLRDRFKKLLNEAIENVIIAYNPTEAMEHAARAGVLDLVDNKQNRINELKIAKEEFMLIFGQLELETVLAGQNLANRAAQSPRFRPQQQCF